MAGTICSVAFLALFACGGAFRVSGTRSPPDGTQRHGPAAYVGWIVFISGSVVQHSKWT